MSGQGHQFPGGFPGNPAMRSNFGGGPMGPAMPGSMSNQLSGVMGGQMNAVGSMVGMGTQMGQAYNPNLQNQMGNMPGMPPQSMAIASSTPSPNQGMGGMGMGTSIGASTSMTGGMAGQGMSSAMAAGGMGTNIGINTSGMAGGPMTGNPALVSNVVANAGATISQNSASTSQANQAANQPQQNKEFNTASLCRFGQETVQDIVSRTQEVFQTLKAIQPPNGTSQGANTSNEKKAKIQEQLRTIRLLFKRLRLIYEKCNENCQVPGMEYTHIESLIPLKEEYEHKTIDEKKTSEAYKVVCEENRELTEQVVLKNKQLKEVINNLRTIIWEINVMLTMRRS